MYVQGSTENQFTEWTPCRNITITITKKAIAFMAAYLERLQISERCYTRNRQRTISTSSNARDLYYNFWN